jgi:uncharacterized protein (DUF58 family)
MGAELRSRVLPDPELVRRFAAFPVRSRLPMEGGFAGIHRGLHRGAGIEFAAYRRYAPGDDVTRVDWRVYGRSDRFYVKEAETESDLVCRILVDATGSMGYGSGPRTKLEAACEVAAVLAALLVRQGDAVGLLSLGGTPAVDIAPRRAPVQVGIVAAALTALRPTGEDDPAEAIAGLAGRLRRRGLVLVFSDAFCDPDTLMSRLGWLAHRGHDVSLFRVWDPREADLDFAGTVRFEDLEGGPATTVAAAAAAVAYRRRWQAHQQRLEAGGAERGVRVLPLSTAAEPGTVLEHFLGGVAQPGCGGGSAWSS